MQPPSPAGWYRDPYGVGVRFFDGSDWTDTTSSDTSLAILALPPTPLAPSMPRPEWLRLIMTIGIALFLLSPAQWITAGAHMVLGDPGWPPLIEPLDSGRMVFPAIVMAIVGPYISYRRRDWLLMLIPFYGWYLTFRIGWRLAYLPYRDWSPRMDEAASWQQLRHPIYPGALLYRPRRPGVSASDAPPFG